MVNRLHQKHNADIQMLIKQPWSKIHMFVCLQKNENTPSGKTKETLWRSSLPQKFVNTLYEILSPITYRILAFFLSSSLRSLMTIRYLILPISCGLHTCEHLA